MSSALKNLQRLATALATTKIKRLDGRLTFEVVPMSFGATLAAREMKAAIAEHVGEELAQMDNLALWLACVKGVSYEPGEDDPAGTAYFAEWLRLAVAGELTPAEVWDTHLAIPNHLTDMLDKVWLEGQRLARDPAQAPGNGLTAEQKADPDLKDDGGRSSSKTASGS